MFSYNNIVEKGAPADRDIIDKALSDAAHGSAPSSVTQSRADPRVDCVVVDNFLSPEECDVLMAACEKTGYSFWRQLVHADTDGESTCDEASKAVRVVDTIEASFPTLSRTIYERIAAVVDLQPKSFAPNMPDADLYERDIEGTWVPHALSENLLFGRYSPGGHFMPHVDGSVIADLNTRSFYTLLIYLNDCPAGGETYLFSGDQFEVMFLDREANKYRGSTESRVAAVTPKKGRVAFFYYNLLHEGAPVGEGLKYICRADLLYRRTPAILDGPKDREAFALYEKARILESSGKAMQACEMFQRIRKLSLGVAELYQID